ncbi:bifunctional phosphoribosyl-AMP cyclohydrolase/phosphoribosyl-ATP diphosphatase HisIE [Buchnera aphidicola]|uniref:bifunctional phosphoribosyl-AMP cyclohydrolase/phosphoribosyl-ATP diphosphatase HisIE n=1 Tax=Buchnera aphidicola TaxID=9 RepID=UPI003464B6B3
MLNNDLLKKIDWKKTDGLIPCIIQNFFSSEILMHGYMNEEALYETQKKKMVVFYSRTKKRLWKKGEQSGNFLNVLNIILDCDRDSLLILVHPIRNTCHLNNNSCFNGIKTTYTDFFYLEQYIKNKKNINCVNSYTATLHSTGIHRIVQKLGEEVIEVVIAALNKNKKDIINESSDLIYHFLVLLHNQNIDFHDIICNLKLRNKNKEIQ